LCCPAGGKEYPGQAFIVDFVIGNHAVARLHNIVRDIENGAGRIVDTGLSEDIEEYDILPEYRTGSVSGFIT
jgi:hypothetical protein